MSFIVAIGVLGAIFAFLMAYSIGANDFANALGTSVGSGAFTLRRAIILGSIFEFAGAVIMGQYVTSTIKKSIVSPTLFADEQELFVLGMFCALAAAVVWILVATYFSLPVSTTHTIVGGVLGFGLVEKGIHAPNWKALGKIIVSWFTSPLLGCLVAFLFFYGVNRSIYRWWKNVSFLQTNHVLRARQLLPFLSGLTAFILAIFIVDAEAARLGGLPKWAEILIGICAGILAGIVVKILLVKFIPYSAPFVQMRDTSHLTEDMDNRDQEEQGIPLEDQDEDTNNAYTTEKNFQDLEMDANNDENEVEWYFKYLQISSAVFVAFAHGSNDIANAIGPFSAILEYWETKSIFNEKWDTPTWIFVIGGVAIVLGLATFGSRVIKTIGHDITHLTFSRGYSAELATATTILIATTLGLPISTTHTLVGGVTGVGFVHTEHQRTAPDGSELNLQQKASGALKRVDLRLLAKIFGGWVVTIIAGSVGTILLFVILRPMVKN